MKDQIISYREMCDIEDIQTLQRGMNYRLNPHYSVILMSQRNNAPYDDKVYDDGITLEYEGHDIPNYKGGIDPKSVDQQLQTENGKLTQNGLFVKTVENFKMGKFPPEIIRVYEKILPGTWSDKGFFELIDYKFIQSGNRNVYRFVLKETMSIPGHKTMQSNMHTTPTRIIPSKIKRLVWERDKGRCVLCGSQKELHFDHELPFSKGGTSLTEANVRILCSKHNLQKSDNIE